MFTVRKVVPALCLAVSMSGLAVYAATTTRRRPRRPLARAATTGMGIITDSWASSCTSSI